MKFLSKVALIAKKIALTWVGLEPATRGFFSKEGKWESVTDTILEVRDVVIYIEEFAANASNEINGAEKLRMAGPMVGKILLRSPLASGRKVKDVNLAMQGANKITDGMADFLNSLDDDLDTQDHT